MANCNIRIWVSAVIVLSSYFGILQSAREQQRGSGVYLCLKGKTNFTGGIVPINMIGETTNNITYPHLAANNYENNGLQCITDKPNCCRVDNRPTHDSIRIGEWYFPNGTAVPILGYGNNRAITFYRNRGYNDSTINLNRVSSNVMSPTGNFCCQVPDSMGRNRTVCANITTVMVTIMSIPPATSIAGDNLTLQCTAKGAGDFLTQIEWLNLESTNGMNIQTNGTSIQLQFIPLQRSHTGVYTCRVTVGDTNFTENYTLHVQSVMMAPSSPQNFRGISDITTVLFSWATPLHPRVVANYALTCVSLSERVDPLIMVYTEVGSYTLGGFRPATMYNCSIVATNNIGSSVPSVISITTIDQGSQFHLWLMKIDSCTEWMHMDAGQKLNDISSAIVDNIKNRCQCGFIRDRISDEAFQCIDGALEAVVYAATIHGTASVNSSILISHIKQWATDGATVTILHEVLNISSVDPTNGECCTETTTSGSLLNETQAKPIAKDNDHTLFIIIGGGSGGGVIIIVIVIIVVIAVIVKCKNRKRGKLRIHKTELVQEEKELNRYENLCASRLQEGVYIEECDYGEIKGQHWGQEDREDVTHHHHHPATNEYEESKKVSQKSDELEYGNIVKSHPDDQTQATSHQQSVLAQIKLAVDKYKPHQSAPAAKHQTPREGTYDVDEEVCDDVPPQQPTDKGQRAPYHPEAMEDCSESKLDCQNYYNYTAIPQSSAAGSGTTRYQPLLSRERDYENNLKDYNNINASQQQDVRGSDEEYEYVTTKLRYYYRPSVK